MAYATNGFRQYSKDIYFQGEDLIIINANRTYQRVAGKWMKKLGTSANFTLKACSAGLSAHLSRIVEEYGEASIRKY